MELKLLKELVRENGIVGAGGAGFPTYVKLDERAETILLNCAECEPLLKLHRQLLERYAFEITKTFQILADAVGAKQAIICVKEEYKSTIQALKSCVDEFSKVEIKLLEGVYPMGDEIVMIYEATGKVVRPGGLPIEEGIAVFNVETVYNIYQAIEYNKPVTDKVISVVAEVESPRTVRVPIGCTIKEVVALAGDCTTEDPVYFVGGPMMGRICDGNDPVTKTTNAILVLPQNHYLVTKKQVNPSIDMKRTASSCCQCQMCSDLCPRNALGHPIEPHLFMRAASNLDFADTDPFVNTLFCSSCGVCELYSCPQSLSPRTLMAEYKDGLRKSGVKPPTVEASTVKPSRQFRKIPEARLEARLGLSMYNLDAPLSEEDVDMGTVKILMSQHIGVPAKPVVIEGELVQSGQLIGKVEEGLGVNIHASIEGKVLHVTEKYVRIKKV